MTEIKLLLNPGGDPKFTEYFANHHSDGEPDTILFRFEGHVYCYENGEKTKQIYLIKYHVKRETPRCWVIDPYEKEKFILKVARKRFAYPTKNLAWDSFKIRLDWRKRFAQREMDKCEGIEELVKHFEKDWDDDVFK